VFSVRYELNLHILLKFILYFTKCKHTKMHLTQWLRCLKKLRFRIITNYLLIWLVTSNIFSVTRRIPGLDTETSVRLYAKHRIMNSRHIAVSCRRSFWHRTRRHYSPTQWISPNIRLSLFISTNNCWLCWQVYYRWYFVPDKLLDWKRRKS
jgi:hypothetical protein